MPRIVKEEKDLKSAAPKAKKPAKAKVVKVKVNVTASKTVEPPKTIKKRSPRAKKINENPVKIEVPLKKTEEDSNENFILDHSDIIAEPETEKNSPAKLVANEIAKEYPEEEPAKIEPMNFDGINVFHPGEEQNKRPLSLYKKIVFIFSLLTVSLVAAVVYFFLVKVEIVLIPVKESVNNSLIFDVIDKEKNSDENLSVVIGSIKEVNAEEIKKYEPSGSKVIGEEVVGKISIINNYIKSQPLVASTRLMSADNKLFRLKESVNVPAGGSLEVEVYADKASPEMSVDSAMRWVIPGLWAGLQDKIYGESKEPMEYREKVERAISASDIEQAVKQTKDSLLSKLKIESIEGYDQVIYQIDNASLVSDVNAKVGEKKDNFTVTMKGKAIIIAFKQDGVMRLAKEKMISTIPSSKELVEFDNSDAIYSLSNYNSKTGIASIGVSFEGSIMPREDQILDKEKIVGLNKKQLNDYLNSNPDLAGAEVTFTPSFITKVPKLFDKIKIEVRK